MEQAGGTGELVNAPGLGKEAVGEGHHGPEVNGGGDEEPPWAFWFGWEISCWKLDRCGRTAI